MDGEWPVMDNLERGTRRSINYLAILHATFTFSSVYVSSVRSPLSYPISQIRVTI